MQIDFDGTFVKSMIIGTYTLIGGATVGTVGALVRHVLTKSNSSYKIFENKLKLKADKDYVTKLETSVNETFESMKNSDSKYRTRIDNQTSQLETKLEKSIEFNYDKIESQIKEQGAKSAEQFETINSQANKTEKVLTFLVLKNEGTASDLKDLGLT